MKVAILYMIMKNHVFSLMELGSSLEIWHCSALIVCTKEITWRITTFRYLYF